MIFGNIFQLEDTQGFIGTPENTAIFWIAYMAMFLIEGDLDGARYLYKRLPAPIKNNTEMKSLWGIGKGLLTRDYTSLKQIISSTTWLHAQPFIADIGDRMKSRQLREIAQAYSVISTVAMGQALLTSSPADTLAIARECGWDVVDNGEYVRPRSLPMESTDGGNGQRSYVKGTKTYMDAITMLSTAPPPSLSLSLSLLITSYSYYDPSLLFLLTTPFFTDVESLQNLSTYVAHFEKKALKIDLSAAASSGSASSSSSSSSSASAPPLTAVPVAMAKKS